jgi:hypothetical protein
MAALRDPSPNSAASLRPRANLHRNLRSPPKFRDFYRTSQHRPRYAQTTPKMPKFVPRQRKHKVVARQKRSHGSNGAGDDAGQDANAAVILPAEQREREERKAAMKTELAKEAQGKMSGKKKKRLDKYIVRPS